MLAQQTYRKQHVCGAVRYARVFVFCYTLALHLLIMGVLARWSHRHASTLAATELACAKQVEFPRLSHNLPLPGATLQQSW